MSPTDQGTSEHPTATANRNPDAEVARLRDVYWSLVGRQARHDQLPGVLRDDRRDFDLVDDRALAAAAARDGALHIRDERYRALILPATLPADPQARAKLDAFVAAGGLLIAVGVPQPADVPGATVRVATPAEVPAALAVLDRQADGPGLCLVRHIAGMDAFLLLPPLATLLPMHAAATGAPELPAQATYRLRTAGSPELWDPVRGTQTPLAGTREGDTVTVTVPFTDWPAAFVVCPTASVPAPAAVTTPTGAVIAARPTWPAQAGAILPDADWTVRPVPTLDNRDGDFDLHGPRGGPDGLLAIERRAFRVRTETQDGDGLTAGWHRSDCDDGAWSVRLWSEAARAQTCRGEGFNAADAQPVVFSTVFGDMRYREWAGRMGRVPRLFLNLGPARKGEVVWVHTNVVAPRDATYWLSVEGSGDKSAWVDDRQVLAPAAGGPHGVQAALTLRAGAHALALRCTPVRDGAVRLGVAVTQGPPAAQPQWIGPDPGEPQGPAVLRHTVVCGAPPRQVRAFFSTQGLVELHVNGRQVAVEGDFNPYRRAGQQELDLGDVWQVGANTVELHFPERLHGDRALVDGLIVDADGSQTGFATGPDWTDAHGRPAVMAPHPGDTEALWIRPRPHLLPDVGWLQPGSVPATAPLPLLLDPQAATLPVWFRAELPVGSCGLHLEAAGAARVWVDGREVDLHQGDASFPPQPAGTLCAIRVAPRVSAPEAAALTAPLRIRTTSAPGALGDWRTALHLPHHSGAVEYEREITVGPGLAWIDLGYVRGTAQVWVDGEDAGVRCWHPYRFALPALRGPRPHRLRIRVTNTLGAHYEQGRPTQVLRPGQAAGGLFGPVRLAVVAPDQ